LQKINIASNFVRYHSAIGNIPPAKAYYYPEILLGYAELAA
jgi:transposase InsO family protein